MVARPVNALTPHHQPFTSLRPGLEPSSPHAIDAMKPSSTFSSAEAFSCSPVPCPALEGCRVLQVSCGSRHTLAVVAGGQAYSWGWGACGQLGHGDDHSIATPKLIEALAKGKDGGPLGPVTWVSAGGIHSAAVVEGGCVYTWGGSSYGQVGQAVAEQWRVGGMFPLVAQLRASPRKWRLGTTYRRRRGVGRAKSC
eukprot:jgi/Undpi1/11442/HiC_scaffold_30.g13739.m1